MCFDTCTINMRVSIRVRGLHASCFYRCDLARAFLLLAVFVSLLPSLWLLLFALIMSCPWLIVMSSLTRSPLPSAGSVDIYIYRYWIDSISIRPPLVSWPFQFEIRWFASPRPRSRSEFGKNARKVELLPRLGVDLQLVLQMFLEEFWTSLIGRLQLRISIQQVELS